MRTANKRKLNRLIRKCFEKGNVNIEPVAMALLTTEEIIYIIVLTAAALKSGDFVPVVSERQKVNVNRRLCEANIKRRCRMLR